MSVPKLSKRKKYLIIIGCVLGLTMGLSKIVPKIILIPPVDIYGTPVEVKKGLFVTPEAMGKVTDEEMQEFIEEYGEDSEITIYEVGT